MPSSYDADTLIDEIDAGTLIPKRHSVIRALQAHIGISDDEVRELITMHDTRVPTYASDLATRIWRKIEALPLEEQGALRLSVGLLHPDAVLDWYEAEYFILWSRQQGVSDERIRAAFQEAVDGS